MRNITASEFNIGQVLQHAQPSVRVCFTLSAARTYSTRCKTLELHCACVCASRTLSAPLAQLLQLSSIKFKPFRISDYFANDSWWATTTLLRRLSHAVLPCAVVPLPRAAFTNLIGWCVLVCGSSAFSR